MTGKGSLWGDFSLEITRHYFYISRSDRLFRESRRSRADPGRLVHGVFVPGWVTMHVRSIMRETVEERQSDRWALRDRWSAIAQFWRRVFHRSQLKAEAVWKSDPGSKRRNTSIKMYLITS